MGGTESQSESVSRVKQVESASDSGAVLQLSALDLLRCSRALSMSGRERDSDCADAAVRDG